MIIEKTPLDGVYVVTPHRFADDRGFFCETWNSRAMQELGLGQIFVQDSQSLSLRPGTVRGLHFQRPPHAQAKLVRCGRGRIFDVAVDIRVGSPTFGQWFGRELSAEKGEQLLIPVGFLHGFMTLEPNCEVLYKCTDFYSGASDGSVRWDSCGIEWPQACEEPILSEKDATAPAFQDFVSPFSCDGL